MSFVLTAQFVLINVVVAVLMKHLDDSNKEAQEDAEMDAEIELELAQGGLCCMMGGIGATVAAGGVSGGAASGGMAAGTVGGPSAGATAPVRDGGGGSAHEGHAHHQHRSRFYSPAQVRDTIGRKHSTIRIKCSNNCCNLTAAGKINIQAYSSPESTSSSSSHTEASSHQR